MSKWNEFVLTELFPTPVAYWVVCLPMVRETGVQSQVESYRRLKKWYLILPCLTLSIIRYVSRVKWSNPRRGVAPSLTSRCSSYWKGSLRVALDYSRKKYIYVYIYAYRVRKKIYAGFSLVDFVLLGVLSSLTFSLWNSVGVFFFFWLGITLLFDYFPVPQMFIAFSFIFLEFFSRYQCA